MKGDERVELGEEGADAGLLTQSWSQKPGVVDRAFRQTGQPSRFVFRFPVDSLKAAQHEFDVISSFWNSVKQRVNCPKRGMQLVGLVDRPLSPDADGVFVFRKSIVNVGHQATGSVNRNRAWFQMLVVFPAADINHFPQLTLFPSCCESPAASSYLSFLHHLSRHLLMIGNSVGWGRSAQPDLELAFPMSSKEAAKAPLSTKFPI